MHVLVVEDEPKMAALIKRVLVAERHVVDVAPDGVGAIALATQGEPDVIVLDRLLPDIDGVTVLRLLRAKGVAAPVLMLTALGAVDDRVAGLDAGADDYLAKPFAFTELLARVRALGRRPSPATSGRLAAGDLALDDLRHVAVVGDRTVDLSAREFALLGFFIRHAGQVVTRQQILDQVWGAEPDVYSNVVDLYVSVPPAQARRARPGVPPADRPRGRVHAQGRGLTPCRSATPSGSSVGPGAGCSRSRSAFWRCSSWGSAPRRRSWVSRPSMPTSTTRSRRRSQPRRRRSRPETLGGDGGEATNGDDGAQAPELDDRPPAAADTFMLVLDGSGKVVQNPSGRTVAGLPDATVLAAARSTGEDLRTIAAGSHSLRLLTVPVIRNGTFDGFVQGGFVLDLHDSQSQSLVVAVVTVGVMGLVAAALITLLVTGRALGPIREGFAAQRRFVADASHELRTPAALIRANAEVLQREGLVVAGGGPLLTDIIGESDRLSGLVGDLLQLSAWDEMRTTITPAPVDVAAIARDTVRGAAAMAAERGVPLAVDGPMAPPGRWPIRTASSRSC